MKTLIKFIFLFLTAGLNPVAANNMGTNVQPDTLLPGGFIRIDTFNLNILPPSSGVQFYQDGILFLSSSRAGSKMLPEHVSFGKIDAMYGDIKDNSTVNPKAFSPAAKFPYPTEAVAFSRDYKTMYFTRYSDNEGIEKIYKATYSDGEGNPGKWTLEENPLSFCYGKSVYTHPALSADGKIMIFSSNQAGSIGGMDLFITLYEGGAWSEPKNLGDAINSRSNEMYPFLDLENNLFYSSDGLLGFGGYDVFVCKFKGNTWESPMNISKPVNTSFDDVAFTMDRKKEESAFYTVKEKSGKKSITLLKVTMTGAGGPDKMTNLSQFFTNPEARNVVMIVTEPAVEATDRRVATDKSRGRDDYIVYRVQILTSFNPKTRQLINLEGKDYMIYEYLYSGAYRLCVGEFSTIAPAIELRNKFIQNDYPQATVVVFRNNIRSFDPDLLEEAAASVPVAAAEKQAPVPAPAVQVKEQPKKGVPVTETRKPEPAKQPVKEPLTTKTEPAKTTLPITETKPAEAVKTTTQTSIKSTDVVVYRVQFASNTVKKGSYSISIGGKNYPTWEYQYSGAYRSTVGEFKTLAEAAAFQKIVRTSGYPQAFVVVFKNNVRSTDPTLFK